MNVDKNSTVGRGGKVIRIKRKIKDLSSRQSRKKINEEPQGTFEEKGAFTPREGKITEIDSSQPWLLIHMSNYSQLMA